MANPNLIAATSILAKTDAKLLTTSNATQLVNSSGSNKIVKIVNLNFANISSLTVTITAQIFISSTNFTATIAHNISIPVGASIVLASKDNPFYLAEGDNLRASSASANSVHCSIVHETVDDA